MGGGGGGGVVWGAPSLFDQIGRGDLQNSQRGTVGT